MANLGMSAHVPIERSSEEKCPWSCRWLPTYAHTGHSGLFFVWIIFYYVEAHEVRKHYGEYVREQIIVEKGGINLIIYF